MREWFGDHQTLFWWMGACSLVLAVGSLLAVPWFVARLPADYLTDDSRKGPFWPAAHPVLRWPAIVLKNLLGVALVACGVAMIVLPGQGLLTIAIGMMLMDFPGKRGLIRALMGRPTIFRGINWIRRKSHRPPLNAAT